MKNKSTFSHTKNISLRREYSPQLKKEQESKNSFLALIVFDFAVFPYYKTVVNFYSCVKLVGKLISFSP